MDLSSLAGFIKISGGGALVSVEAAQCGITHQWRSLHGAYGGSSVPEVPKDIQVHLEVTARGHAHCHIFTSPSLLLSSFQGVKVHL